MLIVMARFPFQKSMESFDFKFQPSIDPKQIRELATGRYMQSGDNVLFLGPSHEAQAKMIGSYTERRGGVPPRTPPTGHNQPRGWSLK